MIPHIRKLGQRALTSPWWRWCPGMLAEDQRCIAGPSEGGEMLTASSEGDRADWWAMDGYVPDFTDAATLGCLVSLVREAWGVETITVRPVQVDRSVFWYAYSGAPLRNAAGADIEGEDEITCWVAALLGAPPPEEGR